MLEQNLLLAQGELLSGPMLYIAIGVVFVAMAFFSFVIMVTKCYKRCPSNRVLCIYGKGTGSGGEAAKCVHGGARIVIPLFRTMRT
jgi:flotillin